MGLKESVNNNRFHGAFNALRDQGYTIISPEYTLARRGQSPFPACIKDGLDVFRWINQNANTYDLDIRNVGVFGESAGAHIALMAALMQHDSLPNQPLQYIVDVYGPTDLEALYKMPILDSLEVLLAKLPSRFGECLDITQSLFGFDPKLDTTLTQTFMMRYSPIEYVHAQTPPVLIIHGDADQIVPISQSVVLAAKLNLYQVASETHSIPQMDHALRKATDLEKDQIQTWIKEFIVNHYNPGATQMP